MKLQVLELLYISMTDPGDGNRILHITTILRVCHFTIYRSLMLRLKLFFLSSSMPLRPHTGVSSWVVARLYLRPVIIPTYTNPQSRRVGRSVKLGSREVGCAPFQNKTDFYSKMACYGAF